MQQLQFSISWLQTTEMSLTSVLETEVKIPPPITPTPLLLISGKVSNPPPPLLPHLIIPKPPQ